MIILHLFFRAKKNFLKHAGEILNQGLAHISHSNSKQMYFANHDVKLFHKRSQTNLCRGMWGMCWRRGVSSMQVIFLLWFGDSWWKLVIVWWKLLIVWWKFSDSWWKFGGGEEYLQCRSHSCFVDSSVTISNCRHFVFPCSNANFKSSYNSDDTDSVDVVHTGKSWKKFRNCSGRRRGTEHLGFPLLGVIMMMMTIIMVIMTIMMIMMIMISFNMMLWHKQ